MLLEQTSPTSPTPSFWSWAASLQPAEQMMLMLMLLGTLIMLVLILSITISRIYKHRLEDSLKRELLERGLSAEEIATVISNTKVDGSRNPNRM